MNFDDMRRPPSRQTHEIGPRKVRFEKQDQVHQRQMYDVAA
jgi:hypothetical protein